MLPKMFSNLLEKMENDVKVEGRISDIEKPIKVETLFKQKIGQQKIKNLQVSGAEVLVRKM